MEPKIIKVSAIKNGTVIDHIPAGGAMAIVNFLKLAKDKTVMLGINFDSKKMGKKDVIKAEDKELTAAELNQVALFAADASVSIIRNFKIAKKFKIELPQTFLDIVKCPNPKCVTNQESVKTKFNLFKPKPLSIKCQYCERIFSREEIALK